MQQEQEVEEPEVRTDEWIEERIIHVLKVYPVISPTMLQVGIGPSLQPKHWKPVLERLIEREVILRETEAAKTPQGRCNNYIKLSLAP